jgi:hypothetical protein
VGVGVGGDDEVGGLIEVDGEEGFEGGVEVGIAGGVFEVGEDDLVVVAGDDGAVETMADAPADEAADDDGDRCGGPLG